MKRKSLQDIANTLPEMWVGWRMTEDLERLAELPDGTLRIDLLRDTAEHSEIGPLTLRVISELRAWLRDRLAILEIPLTALTGANLEAENGLGRMEGPAGAVGVQRDRQAEGPVTKCHEIHRQLTTVLPPY